MLKILVKKQFAEIFRSFFFDQKKNRARSKAGTAGLIALFFLLMFVIMGGIFAFMAYGLVGIAPQGYGWLYYAITGGVGILYGVIGSVFNTYSGLYLAKDNDLLLSMPIPPRTIVAARTLGVYLMGLLYSAAVTLPAAVISFIFVPQTPASVIGAIVMILLVSAIDFVLACLLGWVVAKVSVKLKNRSFFVVLLSLLFVGLYYFVYYKASDAIAELVGNVVLYGDAVKGKAYPVYLFGRVGEGDPVAIAVFCGAAAVLVALSLFFLSRTFLKIATASQNAAAGRKKLKKIGAKGIFSALVSKEFARLFSSATYMLNASLATLLLPVLGVAALIKGSAIRLVAGTIFTSSGGVPVAAACALCVLVSMNLLTTPSVSLEGKSVWIEQSLPIDPKKPLFAKLTLHLILTSLPAAFASVCLIIALRLDVLDALFVFLLPQAFSLLTALFGLWIGTVKPMMNWTREITPVKQNITVFFSMLFGTACVLVFGVLYYTVAYPLPTALYFGIFLAVFLAASAFLLRWTATSGAKRFSRL